MGRPRTILGRPDPCSRDAGSGAGDRRQRPFLVLFAARSTDALPPE
jgi:hypothetical protein